MPDAHTDAIFLTYRSSERPRRTRPNIGFLFSHTLVQIWLYETEYLPCCPFDPSHVKLKVAESYRGFRIAKVSIVFQTLIVIWNTLVFVNYSHSFGVTCHPAVYKEQSGQRSHQLLHISISLHVHLCLYAHKRSLYNSIDFSVL